MNSHICMQIVGHGVRVYSDGSRYEGLFHDGEATGQGTYSSSQGWKVQAQFAGNRPIGHGKWENVAGDTYEGAILGGLHAFLINSDRAPLLCHSGMVSWTQATSLASSKAKAPCVGRMDMCTLAVGKVV